MCHPICSFGKLAKYSLVLGVTALTGSLVVNTALTALGFHAAALKIGSTLSLIGKISVAIGCFSGIAAIFSMIMTVAVIAAAVLLGLGAYLATR